jgi:hypothetical protein
MPHKTPVVAFNSPIVVQHISASSAENGKTWKAGEKLVRVIGVVQRVLI